MSSQNKDGQDWWDSFRQEVRRLLPGGPINKVKAGQPIMVGYKEPGQPFRVIPSNELPDPTLRYLPDGSILDVDKMLEDNTRLLEQLQVQRQLTANAQHHESLLMRRIETLRKKWPAIHKNFFTTEGKDQ